MSDLFEPRCVLVTGGAGFIGSHVLDLLVFKYPQCHFVCLDVLDYCSTEKNLHKVFRETNFKFIQGDVTNADLVRCVILDERIDAIFHFAAATHVDMSWDHSLEFSHTNVLGTHVLLETCRLLSPQVRRFIHVSTDEVYGKPLDNQQAESAFFLETSLLNPTNPYAATKVAAECLIRAYRMSFGIPTIVTRSSNIYGPRQYPEKLIPKCIMLLQENRPFPVHGDGLNRRGYTYVTDASVAFELVLRKGVIGTVYNIGSGFEATTLDVVEEILKHMEVKNSELSKNIEMVRDRPFNDRRYNIGSSRMMGLGWKHHVGFSDGISKTVEWFSNNPGYFGDISRVLVPHPRK